MQIGLTIDGGATFEDLVREVRLGRDVGYRSLWLPESPGGGRRSRSRPGRRHRLFGFDSLTALAALGHELGGVEVGTCVLPTYPRHPMQLATQALTARAALAGGLALGIGVSHRHIVEDQWGYTYDRNATRMREYVEVLNQLMGQGTVDVDGETVQAHGSLGIPFEPVPLLVAALGPRMLEIAGRHADGVISWMTGPQALAGHVVPRLTEAAQAAGRPTPRVVASLPVCVSDDVDAARRLAERMFVIYGSLPNYRRVLARDGAEHAGQIALVGTEADIRDQISELERIGITDLNALVIGDDESRTRAHALLPALSEASHIRERECDPCPPPALSVHYR